MLNLTHLRTLSVVLSSGSFAAAARRLDYTPSAVSQQVASLEKQLRVALFEREAHAVRPTAAALAVVERARPALGALRTLEEDLELLTSGSVGRLRIVSFPTASERLLPATLTTLRRRLPRVEVELDEAEPLPAMKMLEAGEADIAITYAYSDTTPRHWLGHDLRPVLTEDLLVISRPERLAPVAEVPARVDGLRELAGATWLATSADTLGAHHLMSLCRDDGFEPDIRFRSNNYGVLQGLVSSGVGVALVPALALGPRSSVTARCVSSKRARRHVSAALASSVPERLAGSVMSALRRAAAGLNDPYVRPVR